VHVGEHDLPAALVTLGLSFGVENWKFCVSRVCAFCCQYTHCSPLFLSTEVHEFFPVPVAIGIAPRMPAGDPITFSIQVANEDPFGLLTSSIVSLAGPALLASENTAIVGQMAGLVPLPAWVAPSIQMLCQCDKKTRPPRLA